MEDVDGQVVPLLAHHVLRFLLPYHSRSVMRVHDVVTDLKANIHWCFEFEVGNRRLVYYLLC
jgi:hypothetical protein